MVARPEIFQYHNYQSFLRDWVAYRKATQSRFSLRKLSQQAGLASGYLPMVLSEKRPLSGNAMAKLVPFLGLSASEQSFFENLVVLGTSDSHDARITALERMKRFSKYQRLNPGDSDAYEYLTHWYYVAIRELSTLEGFQADPAWIQSQLRFAVPLSEIKTALDFLTKNGYLEHSDKTIDCSGGIYRVALAQFHREIFSLATRSIEKTPSVERSIQGRALALSESGFEKAKEIVEEAMEKLKKLGETETQGDTVYHMEVALFPLSSNKKKTKENKK